MGTAPEGARVATWLRDYGHRLVVAAEKIDKNIGVEKDWPRHSYSLSHSPRMALKSGRSVRSFQMPATSCNTASRRLRPA